MPAPGEIATFHITVEKLVDASYAAEAVKALDAAK